MRKRTKNGLVEIMFGAPVHAEGVKGLFHINEKGVGAQNVMLGLFYTLLSNLTGGSPRSVRPEALEGRAERVINSVAFGQAQIARTRRDRWTTAAAKRWRNQPESTRQALRGLRPSGRRWLFTPTSRWLPA